MGVRAGGVRIEGIDVEQGRKDGDFAAQLASRLIEYARAQTKPRSEPDDLDTTPEPPATGEIAVVHLVPFEGQVAYAVEYGRFDGLAFCSRAVEAGILQRRSNPTSTMELAILTSWARLAQAQGTICTTTLLEGTSTYRFEYTYPDGRSIPGLTASERSHHAATFVRPDMSRDFWDSLLDILERS